MNRCSSSLKSILVLTAATSTETIRPGFVPRSTTSKLESTSTSSLGSTTTTTPIPIFAEEDEFIHIGQGVDVETEIPETETEIPEIAIETKETTPIPRRISGKPTSPFPFPFTLANLVTGQMVTYLFRRKIYELVLTDGEFLKRAQEFLDLNGNGGKMDLILYGLGLPVLIYLFFQDKAKQPSMEKLQQILTTSQIVVSESESESKSKTTVHKNSHWMVCWTEAILVTFILLFVRDVDPVF